MHAKKLHVVKVSLYNLSLINECSYNFSLLKTRDHRYFPVKIRRSSVG